MEIDIPQSMKLVDSEDHDFCFQCGKKQKGFIKIKAAWDYDQCSDCDQYLA